MPPQSDLQYSIPTGRLAIAVKPFVVPSPAFGPGSMEHVRRKAEELELIGESEGNGSKASAPTNSISPTSGAAYAGAGSYF